LFDVLETALADSEYYAPFSTVRDPGPRLGPGAVAEGWHRSERDIWAFWSRPGLPEVEQGWKIHVSAQISRVQSVLDTVAEACFSENVPFKHLATRRFYLFLHHKHAPRPQTGKFCALYPPDTDTARRLLDRLADALDGEEGAYVLTDRHYRDSRTVHYRYGAFRGRGRLLPDGTQELLRRDMAAIMPPPADLWARATAFYPSGPGLDPNTPTPDEVDADPTGCLARLSDRLAAGLLAMADCDREAWVFPPPPTAFATNTVCVGYGTAGVVHALLRAGVAVPEAVEKRLRRDAVSLREELPPGLDAGVAGIARVLAQLGHLDEANDLALLAENHPLTASCATLAGGRAGVGLLWLDLYRRTGDARALDRAVAAGDFIAQASDLLPFLGARDARGLFHGRSGLALFLHRLFEETGVVRYLAAGSRLLHEELDRAMELPDGALSFSDNAVVRRAMPYLGIGSAGVGTALTRYVHTEAACNERFAAALPRIVADADKPCAMESGLYAGLAGLAHFLTEHAALTGEPTDRERAVKVATGLLKYAVPHGDGVRFLGTGALRFSADLSSGSAGVLLTVRRILDGPGVDLFA